MAPVAAPADPDDHLAAAAAAHVAAAAAARGPTPAAKDAIPLEVDSTRQSSPTRASPVLPASDPAFFEDCPAP